MNLVEHYIIEIYDVKENKYGSEKYLIVDLQYNCYGTIKREKRVFTKEGFEEAKQQGYFMA